MNQMQQNMTIHFTDGGTKVFTNFMTHQVGGECLQVVYGDRASIYPLRLITEVQIEAVQVADNIVDVQIKE